MLKPTMPTLKFLSVAIRLPFGGVDVSATRTSLGCVSGWNKHDQYTSDCSLVINKQPELIKRPVVRLTSLSFAAWLLVKTVTNSGQVFKSQCGVTVFRELYQLLATLVALPFPLAC